MSYLLHPPLLDEVGLQSALQWYVDGLAKRSGMAAHIDVRPHDFPRLDPQLERALFRIVQEALTNVFRHAGARETWVDLVKEENTVSCIVRDDGKGISGDIADFRPDSIGIGISGMRQRVKEFGGELRLGNAAPGTTVEVIIPIQPVTSPNVPDVASVDD
ncbi:MAG: sensor histidine kinase [Blastocatellia bacterium]